MELIGSDLVDADTIESVCKGLGINADATTLFNAREVVAKLMREQNES